MYNYKYNFMFSFLCSRYKNSISNIFLTIPDSEMYSEVLALILEFFRSAYGLFGYINEDGDLVSPSLTMDIIDRIRKSSDGKKLKNGIPVSISLGTYTKTEKSQKIENIIEMADREMYEDKARIKSEMGFSI